MLARPSSFTTIWRCLWASSVSAIDGSSGGQNGMESVIDHLGTDGGSAAACRASARRDASAAWLTTSSGTFTRAEREALDGAIDRAADAVEHARRHGVEAAMNLFNQPATPDPAAKDAPGSKSSAS